MPAVRNKKSAQINFTISFKSIIFAAPNNMVVLAQLVRASDCGSEGRGFEPHIPPEIIKAGILPAFIIYEEMIC